MMFVRKTTRIEPGRIQLRCACGTEHAAAQCPACGRRVPKAVSVNGGPWITYQEHQRNGLRQMLESIDSNDVPDEHSELARRNLRRQIRELEDGSWKAGLLQRITLLKNMLNPPEQVNLDLEKREALQKLRPHLETQVQALKEELEDAGTPYDENAPSATPRYFTGVFTRPKVTKREWEEDPMHVVQKVAAAIALQIKPENMMPQQRDLVSAWFYASAMEGGGHTDIFSNGSGKDDSTAKSIPGALRVINATAHILIFQKAAEQWASKPRHYRAFEGGGREKLSQWIKEVQQPLREEFTDIDAEARRAKSSLESCIVAYLKEHQSDFVEITDA